MTVSCGKERHVKIILTLISTFTYNYIKFGPLGALVLLFKNITPVKRFM